MSGAVVVVWQESKWIRRLEILGWCAAIAVVFRLALQEDFGWFGWMIAGVVVALATVMRWPYGALVVLVGASAMPVFYLELFGLKARPEHLVAGLIAIEIAVWVAKARPKLQLNILDYWILAYVVVNYVSSAFGSTEPGGTLRWALQNNLAVLPYFLIRILVRDWMTLAKVFRILLGVAIAESVYGILCYLSNHLFGTATGMVVGDYLVNVSAPYGTMYEPNLFGAYTAACAVIFLSLYLGAEHARIGNLIGFVIASVATVLSFSRAALFALVVVICFVLWKAPSSRSTYRAKIVIVGLICALALMVAVTAVGGVLQERVADLFAQGLTEETTISRVLVTQQALQEIPNHPWIGSGTASFNLSFDWTEYIPEWASDKTWIGNAPLRILHDTGIVGFTTVAGFLVSIWMLLRKQLRKANGRLPLLLGLTAGALLYGISFQSTDGTILAFTWVHLGLLASAAILGKDLLAEENEVAQSMAPSNF
jgi:O-antigen ligase